MLLTIVTEADLIITIECAPENTVAVLKEKISAQVGIPEREQSLHFNGNLLTDAETVGGIGAQERDVIMLEQHQAPDAHVDEQPSGVFGHLSRQQWINSVRNSPQLLLQLQGVNPELAEAILSNDGDRVEALVIQAKERDAAKQREIQQLMMNPMDIDSQRKIEELIHQRNIEENFNQAMEHTPEAFGSVSMLYINVEVNRVPVQAFVDTGAQMTIMTAEFADKCSLTRLIDKRFAGTAYGVGQSKIVGQVHQAPLKVGGQVLASSLIVLEQRSGPPFIFGLNNLLRHQCVINLNTMKLCIGSVNVEVPFLAEHEVKKRDEMFPPTDPSNSASVQTPSASATSSSIMEDKIQNLMALGFDREKCVNALKVTDGNEEAAAALLFG